MAVVSPARSLRQHSPPRHSPSQTHHRLLPTSSHLHHLLLHLQQHLDLAGTDSTVTYNSYDAHYTHYSSTCKHENMKTDMNCLFRRQYNTFIQKSLSTS